MRLALVIALLFSLLIACAPTPDVSEPDSTSRAQDLQIVNSGKALPDRPEHEPPRGMPDEDQTEAIAIEAVNYNFLPSQIDVKHGSRVRFIVTAMDDPHTFVIDEYGIDEELPVGEDVTIEFVADREGVFFIESTTPSDKAQRMRGKLIVT